MASLPGESAEEKVVNANMSLAVGATKVDLSLPIPDEKVKTRRLLPILQTFTGAIVEACVRNTEAEGREISCKAGCGACCRQLVPIAVAEAYHIAELVERMPEPRRSEIKERFRQGLEKADAAGCGATARAEIASKEQAVQDALVYFRMGHPCPFLEEESCSIHPDRPLSCREYLVTNDPQHCADPNENDIKMVKLPGPLWSSLTALDSPSGNRYTTLINALEYARENPESEEVRPAKDLFEQFMRKFLGH